MRWSCLVLIFLLPVSVAWAGSFKCRDATGHITFQQMPCAVEESGISPLQAQQITAAEMKQTLTLFLAAIAGHDQRAQLSLLADDFSLSVYDDSRFDYVRSRYGKGELIGQSEPGRLFRQLQSRALESREWMDKDAHWLLLQVPQAQGEAVLGRIQLAIVNGQLLIRRWDAVR